MIHFLMAALFNTEPAQASLRRLVPSRFSSQIHFSPLLKNNGKDRFEISGSAGSISIAGTTNATLLTGFNWYLNHVAHGMISLSGDQLNLPRLLPKPPRITIASPYRYRYALNENVAGYTAPYWNYAQWERAIDVFALSGINRVLIENGMEDVLYSTFRDFGYSDDEMRHWIVQPAHQNWQLMQNMCCFDEPISRSIMLERVALSQRVIAHIRELGMQPVFPGYSGMVPEDFASKNPSAHVVPQGKWVGFTRPAWLDSRDPLFAKLAASFYKHQRQLFGDADIYDIEMFHEGGTPGDVPVGEAARAVQQQLETARPGALWMLLAWGKNPRPEVLDAIDRSKLFIVDNQLDRSPNLDRERDFKGAKYVFSGLWNFGQRTTLGANVYDYAVRLPQIAAKPGSNMEGIAVFPEGLGNNPLAFDLFTEMGWRTEAVDIDRWVAQYSRYRYGIADVHAKRAWNIILRTAYATRADGDEDHGERDAAQESLFDARPDLDATTASSWSPDLIRYDPAEFAKALPELLAVAPALRSTATYQFDLVDVTRQVLANRSRELLPLIKAAYVGRDRTLFDARTHEWLQLMNLQDDLLATNRSFLLGPWLEQTHAWAADASEQSLLEYDVRSLLTTWGTREASNAGLHDYADKDWAGLTCDFYLPRWKAYFDSLDTALAEHTKPKTIDWFTIEDEWNRRTNTYATQPHGDPYEFSQLVYNVLSGRSSAPIAPCSR